MKVKGIEKKFTPISLEITIETPRELEALIILFGYTNPSDRAEFINKHLENTIFPIFKPEEVCFTDVICNYL